MDHLSVIQRKDALDAAIHREIVGFESETDSTILGITIRRLDIGELKTICTGVSIEVKNL